MMKKRIAALAAALTVVMGMTAFAVISPSPKPTPKKGIPCSSSTSPKTMDEMPIMLVEGLGIGCIALAIVAGKKAKEA